MSQQNLVSIIIVATVGYLDMKSGRCVTGTKMQVKCEYGCGISRVTLDLWLGYGRLTRHASGIMASVIHTARLRLSYICYHCVDQVPCETLVQLLRVLPWSLRSGCTLIPQVDLVSDVLSL